MSLLSLLEGALHVLTQWWAEPGVPQPMLDPNTPLRLFNLGITVLVALLAVIDFLRTRDRPRFEIALFFVLMAIGFRFSVEPEPPRLFTIAYICFVSSTYIMLRIVRHFRPLPRTIDKIAAVSMVIGWLIYILTPPRTPPAHPLLSLFLSAYLLLISVYVALSFVQGALATRGVTHWRFIFAATGVFLILTVSLGELGRLVVSGPQVTPIAIAEVYSLLIALSSLAYYFGFSPPAWLRRAWALAELHRFLREVKGRSIGERAREIIDVLCPTATQAVGGLTAVTILWDETSQGLILHRSQAYVDREVGFTSENGAIRRAWQQRRATVALTPAEFGPDEARLAETAGARALLVVPIATDECVFGLLVVFFQHQPLFLADDIAVLELFTEQSAIALANADLFDEQRQLLDKLQQANLDLERVSQHKSEFLANMSHELRTPLNAILGFSEVLLERLFGDLNEKQAEYLQDILSSGQHLLALINDILDLSKVEAGRLDLEIEHFALPETLETCLALFRERANRQGLNLSLEVDSRIHLIAADERKVKQVLFNLLSNAVKFTPDGGQIDIIARLIDHKVQISVRDTGIGIPPEAHLAIFEEFHQTVEGSRVQESTGLGLTLAKKFIELHGGQIWVESEVGVGSTFTFTLPLGSVRRDDSPSIVPPRLTTPDASNPIILVVEDDPHAAELLTVYLSGAGFQIALARDGIEGIELARNLHPTEIILDIMLPRMNGWDFLVQIKLDPILAAILVIIVSIIDERGKGLALGATEYLLKPISREDLLIALHRPAVATKLPANQGRVLAIDDDPLVLELIDAVLRPAGYTVWRAANGDEGMDLAHEVVPDLVILDLLMPHLDGFAVVKELRSNPATMNIPVIIFTAKTMTPEDKDRLNGRINFLARKSDFDRAAFLELVQSFCPSPVT